MPALSGVGSAGSRRKAAEPAATDLIIGRGPSGVLTDSRWMSKGRVRRASEVLGQLRTGAYISRSDLFGGLEDSFGTNYFYQVGGRFVMDVQGLFWKLEYVGVGAGYFWSETCSGWTIGAEISFAF